jgi:hypothetical protein
MKKAPDGVLKGQKRYQRNDVKGPKTNASITSRRVDVAESRNRTALSVRNLGLIAKRRIPLEYIVGTRGFGELRAARALLGITATIMKIRHHCVS